MSDRIDAVARLQSLASQFKQREMSLRQALNVLAGQLVAACEGASIYATGKNCRIEDTAPDEWYHGYFAFNGHSLLIGYRHSVDMSEHPDFGPLYDTKTLDAATPEWLKRLIDGGSLDTLLRAVAEQLQQQISGMEASAQAVDHLANNPSLGLASSFEQAAQKLGYDRAISDWKEAQLAIHANPEAAITRACSLLETVCQHVLQDLNKDLPADKSIQPLFRAACKALHLDPAEQADPDLKAVCGGLATVAQGVGTLRTKFGDAHGKGPAHVPLTPSHARLAVNAAGTAAAFLMERWLAEKEA